MKSTIIFFIKECRHGGCFYLKLLNSCDIMHGFCLNASCGQEQNTNELADDFYCGSKNRLEHLSRCMWSGGIIRQCFLCRVSPCSNSLHKQLLLFKGLCAVLSLEQDFNINLRMRHPSMNSAKGSSSAGQWFYRYHPDHCYRFKDTCWAVAPTGGKFDAAMTDL